MKIRQINKIIALVIMLSVVVTNLGLNVYAQNDTTYKETVENKDESKGIIENAADNKGSKKSEARVVKELKDLRTTNTTTYLLSDGSRKLEINGRDIRYKEGKQLKDYNPDLKKLSTNNIKELKEISKENHKVLPENKVEAYEYVNTAGDSKLYFPETFDEDIGILLKKDDYAISFTPLMAAQRESEEITENKELLNVEEKDSLPLYINNVKGNNITYGDKKEGIEYKYTSLTYGIKEEIILNERPDNNIFEFNLNLPGMKIEKAQFGKGLNFIDKKTNTKVAFIDEPNIKGQKSEIRYEEVSYEIEKLSEEKYILKVIVDDNYLNSSDTKYPVVIDPTVVWMDSYLPCATLSNNPLTANSNLRVNSYFPVQNRAMNVETDLNTEYMCYISTSYSPLSGNLEQFYGAKVESANLKIVEYNIASPYKPGTIEVRTPEGVWGANTLTWNNHPEIGNKVWAQFTTTGTPGKRYDVDLTSWAQAVADRRIKDYGLALKAKNQGTGAYFYSPSLQNLNYLQLSIIYYPYVATVNHYYDNAYDVRYSQSKYGNIAPVNVIKQHQDWVSSVFETLFSLKIISNMPQKYTSLADKCKLKQGMTINTTTINQQCPGGIGHGFIAKNNISYSKCTEPSAEHKSFIEDKPSDGNCCNVLWTGNQLYEEEEPYNRAWFWYNSVFIFEPHEPDIRSDREKRTIMHELGHNFGAPDEYCPNKNLPPGRVCPAAGCPDHHPERFIGECIMGVAMYDPERISYAENIFCQYCIEDIKEHLENHHRVSPLVVTPENGETIGEAVKRVLGTTDVDTINKIKITGNAVMESSIQAMELTNILPNLKEVDLSGFSGTLGTNSFYHCTNLQKVKLPANIELPAYTFAQCKNLDTVYQEGNTEETGEIDLSGVKSVGDCAFQNTSGMAVKLPETLGIPQYCFMDCKNLRTIYKKDDISIDGEIDLSGAISLGVGAFWNAGSFISAVNLPKNVEIPDDCFKNCSNLKEVRFDISQTSKVTIGTSAFSGVNSSCIAYMNQTLVEDTGFVISMSSTINMPKQIYPLIVKPNSGETMKQAITRELGTISADTVKKIKLQGNAVMGSGASNEDSAKMLPELEVVDLSEFAGKLGNFAFHTCEKLKTVILPKGNINLPVYVFSDCQKLDTIYKKGNEPVIGECDLSGVVSAGNYAFMNTAISKVKLPLTFTIPQYCFIACGNLSTIYKTGNLPVEGELDLSGVSSIGHGAFWNYFGNVPKFSTVKLSASSSIGGNCFRSCANLVTVYKNGKVKVNGEADLSGVTSFGAGAFSGTSTSNAPKIGVVILPKNVAIPNECFKNCSYLKKVEFDETQTTKVSIGASAFYGVNGLCVAYMHQTLANDTSFVLPISSTINMPKYGY